MKRLIKAVKAECDALRESYRECIEKGDKVFSDRDAWIERYSTATRWKQYQEGKITRSQAVEYATKRALKEVDKIEENKKNRIEAVIAAPDLDELYIQVEWKRSAIWEMNPTATIKAYGVDGQKFGEYKGFASGCGYDKESAAIAEALNKCPSVLKLLYMAEEKRLSNKNTRYKSRRDVLGNGSGYGALPYFEGGVRYESLASIFERLGFISQKAGGGRQYDFYRIIKGGEGK